MRVSNAYYIIKLVHKELENLTGIIKILSMLFSYLFSYMILMQIDKKYSLIIKKDSRFKFNKAWKPVLKYKYIKSKDIAGIGLNV